MTAITEPGVYDLPDDVYHADPVPDGSLSVSGARLLLPPSCPARFAWQRGHPRAPSEEFDIGHAAHMLALGSGPDLMLIDAKDWRTKAAQAQALEARSSGFIPLLRAHYDMVHAMVAALRQHPSVGLLFSQGGQVEQSLFWTDDLTGVWCRGRPDWMPKERQGRLIVVDYKTTKSASPNMLGKAAADYGYDMQAAWYLDGARTLGLGEDDAAFIFVFQEKTPPYLVTPIELDTPALNRGHARNRRALEIYRDCTEADAWPGYTDDIELVSLPLWAFRDQEVW